MTRPSPRSIARRTRLIAAKGSTSTSLPPICASASPANNRAWRLSHHHLSRSIGESLIASCLHRQRFARQRRESGGGDSGRHRHAQDVSASNCLSKATWENETSGTKASGKAVRHLFSRNRRPACRSNSDCPSRRAAHRNGLNERLAFLCPQSGLVIILKHGQTPGA